MNTLSELSRAGCALTLLTFGLVGCATPQASNTTNSRSAYVLGGVGVTRFEPDTLNDTLSVEEDTSVSGHLGLGFQFNRFAAVELRAAQLGVVEYEDGRNLTYQVADASGLLMLRQGQTSIFARLGVGAFRVEGDFDVELGSDAHAVVGGGLIFHATPKFDLRLSVSSHGADALWSKLSAVWRFGQSSSTSARVIQPSVGGIDTDGNDGFTAVEPVATVEPNVIEPVRPEPIITQDGGVGSSGLLIEEKPAQQIQTAPDSLENRSTRGNLQLPEVEIVAGAVPSVSAESPAVSEPVAEPAPLPEPAEDLLATDTILPIGPLQFVPGSSNLNALSLVDVEELVDLLRVNPELELTIEAHAAPVGNADLNMLLSRRRALTVIRLLVDEGIVATRLRPRAFGDTAPIADADPIDLNDRVELRVR